MLNQNEDNPQGAHDPEMWWKAKEKYSKTEESEQETLFSSDEDLKGKRVYSFFQHFKIQLIISLTIFVLFVFLHKLDEKKTIQAVDWIKKQINNDIPFEVISQWYTTTFSGSPSFIPLFDNKSQEALSKEVKESLSMPVSEPTIVRSFAESMSGIELATEKGAEVVAVDEGRVVFVREEQDTIIIQHRNRYISIYSKLAVTNVELNQWVSSGEKIGSMSVVYEKPLLFYAIKKDNQYIDPLGVISFE